MYTVPPPPQIAFTGKVVPPGPTVPIPYPKAVLPPTVGATVPIPPPIVATTTVPAPTVPGQVVPAYRTAGPLPVPTQAPRTFVPVPPPTVRSPTVLVPPPTVRSPTTVPVPPPTVRSPTTVPPPPVRTTVVVPPPPVRSPTTVAIPLPPVQPARLVLAPPPVVIPVPEPVEVEELVLRPRQVDWANRAHEILMNTHGVIDTSKMGSGKTFTTLWQAKQLNLPILVISLVTLEDMWRTYAAMYGVELIDFISYGELRSTTGHQPKHGYLVRRDEITEGNKKFVSFTPTQPYLDLVRDGIMVICDEIDKIKNTSGQYRAAAAMLHPIVAPGSVSRFMLLSAIPFDKQEHAINLLRLIGYVRHPRLYTYVGKPPRQMRLEGMQELIDAANFIDEAATRRILEQVPLIKSKMTELVYRLYSEVILNRIAGSMPPPDIAATFDAKNGFYNIHPNNMQRLIEGIAMLANAVGYVEGAAVAQIRNETMGAVTQALVQIESAKTFDLARVAQSLLTLHPTGKVIISVNYTDTIEYLRRALAAYNPVLLYGAIPPRQRQALVNQFNADPTKRLLIMNTAVGGHGISLHDTIGNQPRFMLLSPSYKLLEIAQATGRIYRDGTMSDATVRMFYGKGRGAQETNILNAIVRKTLTAKGTVAGPARDALVLPGDYPNEVEP